MFLLARQSLGLGLVIIMMMTVMLKMMRMVALMTIKRLWPHRGDKRKRFSIVTTSLPSDYNEPGLLPSIYDLNVTFTFLKVETGLGTLLTAPSGVALIIRLEIRNILVVY